MRKITQRGVGQTYSFNNSPFIKSLKSFSLYIDTYRPILSNINGHLVGLLCKLLKKLEKRKMFISYG